MNWLTNFAKGIRSLLHRQDVEGELDIRDQVSHLISHDELISTLTGIFSVLALLLAAIGLYGVMSYNVARRTNEIGIRLALGARSGNVPRMIMGESLLLLAIGGGAGVAAGDDGDEDHQATTVCDGRD